jgi:O-antigen/teichoic acid export membrane protein
LEKVAMLTMPLMAFMIATSDWIVLLLLGPKWIGVSRIFALLAIAGFVQPICNTAGWLFITQGRSKHMLQWGLIGSPIIIVSIVAGLPWGAVGVAFTYSLTFLLIVAPTLFWFIGRSGPVRAWDFYVTLGPTALASICALLISIGFRSYSGVSNGLIGIVSCFLITALSTLLVLVAIPSGRRALIDARDSVLLLLRRASVSEV